MQVFEQVLGQTEKVEDPSLLPETGKLSAISLSAQFFHSVNMMVLVGSCHSMGLILSDSIAGLGCAGLHKNSRKSPEFSRVLF